jgi:hypothetical protein
VGEYQTLNDHVDDGVVEVWYSQIGIGSEDQGMNRADFSEKFEHLRSAPDEFGTRNTAGLNEAGIEHAAEALVAKFPDDYSWFLKNYWTGMFGAVDLYTLDASDRSYIGSRQPPDVSGTYVAIADDGFGNAYCFPVTDGQCRDEVVIVPLLGTEFTGKAEYGGVLEFICLSA